MRFMGNRGAQGRASPSFADSFPIFNFFPIAARGRSMAVARVRRAGMVGP